MRTHLEASTFFWGALPPEPLALSAYAAIPSSGGQNIIWNPCFLDPASATVRTLVDCQKPTLATEGVALRLAHARHTTRCVSCKGNVAGASYL